MNNIVKWALIACGSLLILICILLVVVPFFVDVEQYKPMVEKRVSAAIGRPFSIGGDMDLSLFPFAGISFSDLHVGNPEGFEEKEFVRIRNFQARVKLLPLLFKDVQIDRFILEGPEVTLITQKNGRVNWEMAVSPPAAGPEKETAGKPSGGLPLKGLAVDEMSLKEGLIRVIDHAGQRRTEITDISAQISDVALDRPLKLFLAATINGLPLSLRGNVGPLGRDIGAGDIPVDVTVEALNEATIDVSGKILHPANGPAFALAVRCQPFSPKNVIAGLGRGADAAVADTDALRKMAFSMAVQGDARTLSISEGNLVLDDSTLAFDATVKAFDKPDISFNAALDRIDADRYLPAAGGGSPPAPSEGGRPGGHRTDLSPLRSLALKGNATIGSLKIKNIQMKNVAVTLTGSRGIIRANPVTMDMYEGRVEANGVLNAAAETPKTGFSLHASEIRAGGLIKDLLGKDMIEGVLKANIDLKTAGTDPAAIKKSLTGTANILFNNGAIKGVDLTAMVRNVKTAFNGGVDFSQSGDKRTDFSEFYIPLSMNNGMVKTSAARLVSPALRVEAQGRASLLDESLDLRVQPKFVATTAGQGDAKERSGLMVPVLITGTFSSPKFAPDVGGVIRQGLENRLRGSDGDTPGSLEETTKGLLENLPFGR